MHAEDDEERGVAKQQEVKWGLVVVVGGGGGGGGRRPSILVSQSHMRIRPARNRRNTEKVMVVEEADV